MLDDLHDSDNRRSLEVERRSTRTGDAARPMADREVPLHRDGLAPALHAWLDGELPEAVVRKGTTARDAELWRRINLEARQLRHMQTPAGFEDRIMAALPSTAPAIIDPWYRREMVMTPAKAITAGAILVTAAAIATVLVLQLAG